MYTPLSVPVFILFPSSSGDPLGHLLCVSKRKSRLSSLKLEAADLVTSLCEAPSAGGVYVVTAVLSNPAHCAGW